MCYRVHTARSETLEDGHEKSAPAAAHVVEQKQVGDDSDGPRRRIKSLNDWNDARERRRPTTSAPTGCTRTSQRQRSCSHEDEVRSAKRGENAHVQIAARKAGILRQESVSMRGTAERVLLILWARAAFVILVGKRAGGMR